MSRFIVRFAFLGLMLMLGPNAFCQFYLGVKGGFGASRVVVNNPIGGEKSKSSMQLGLVAAKSIDVRKRLFLVAEVLYTQRGSSTDSFQLGFQYIDIPLLFRVHIPIMKKTGLMFFLNGGPYLGFRIGSSLQEQSKKDYGNLLTGRTAEYGMVFGGGLAYPLKIKEMDAKIFIEGRYVFSLINMDDQSQSRNRVNVFSLGLLLAPPFLNKKQSETFTEPEINTP